MLIKSLNTWIKRYQLFVYKKRFYKLVKKYMHIVSDKKEAVLSEIEDLFSIVYLVGEMAIPLEMEIRKFVIRERKSLKSVEQRPVIGAALRAFIEQREGERIKVSYVNKRQVDSRQHSRKLMVGKPLNKKR